MVVERPVRRMTLRQQLTHSEKCCRNLIEHFQAVLLPRIADFRDLSRPVRRRSSLVIQRRRESCVSRHYP